jgi:hypothetical protein
MENIKKKSPRYSPEVHERAVRMVLEHQGEHESQWKVIASIAAKIKAINRVCRSMRTRPLRDQHQRLSRMLKGHYAYFGISGNYERLATLPYQVARIWRKWLSRRLNKRSLPWVAFAGILKLFPLPQPRIVHSLRQTVSESA